MRKQHNTGNAPTGSVVCLSDWLASHSTPSNFIQCTKPRCRAWHGVSKPEGARDGDIFVCSEILDASEKFKGVGIDDGDFLIFLVTDDIKEGDLVALRWRGASYTGFLEIEEDRWMLTDAEGEPKHGYFEADPLRVVGRCVEVQRKARRVRILRALRPAHAVWESVAEIGARVMNAAAGRAS